MLKLFGLGLSVAEAAVEIELLQAEETESTPQVFYLPDQVAKARQGADGPGSLKEELQPILSAKLVHAPVIRYTLHNCMVRDHGVDFVGGRISKVSRRRLRDRQPPVHQIPQAIYCMTPVAHQYFGHWLRDSCATALLARSDESVLMDARPDWPHVSEYIGAFALQPHHEHPTFVQKLTVFQDFSQGSSKRARYDVMRTRAAAHFGPSGQPPQPVYLRRGQTGARRAIENEDEVIRYLQGQGYKVIDVAGASARELYHQLKGSPVVVTVEGSHINHLYMALDKGCSLMVIMPADRFSSTHFGIATALGIHFGFLVAERHQRGYHVRVEDLARTLDLLP
ncbi:MAG: glycosyltransferase family 61 protein [Burkholderiaceae bacterium]